MSYGKGCIGLASAALLLVGCGGLLGDDDSASGADETAASSTTIAEGAQGVEPTDPPEATENLDSELVDDSEAKLAGRTGPIRELPGLAEWADLDLKPFLMEVMLLPAEVPVPDNAILTWISVTQQFTGEATASNISANARYQPLFSMDEFRTLLPELFSGTSFVATGVDEDLEDKSLRLTFSSEDISASFSEITFTYTDADTSSQAELYMYSRGNIVDGRSEVVVNETLFPWVSEIVVDPAMVNDFVTYNIGRLEGKAEIDRRWDAPVPDFERLSDFYRLPSGSGFAANGEMEYSDTVWPTNEVEVIREDGYTGSIKVSQTDPERDVSIIVRGRYVLE